MTNANNTNNKTTSITNNKKRNSPIKNTKARKRARRSRSKRKGSPASNKQGSSPDSALTKSTTASSSYYDSDPAESRPSSLRPASLFPHGSSINIVQMLLRHHNRLRRHEATLKKAMNEVIHCQDDIASLLVINEGEGKGSTTRLDNRVQRRKNDDGSIATTSKQHHPDDTTSLMRHSTKEEESLERPSIVENHNDYSLDLNDKQAVQLASPENLDLERMDPALPSSCQPVVADKAIQAATQSSKGNRKHRPIVSFLASMKKKRQAPTVKPSDITPTPPSHKAPLVEANEPLSFLKVDLDQTIVVSEHDQTNHSSKPRPEEMMMATRTIAQLPASLSKAAHRADDDGDDEVSSASSHTMDDTALQHTNTNAFRNDVLVLKPPSVDRVKPSKQLLIHNKTKPQPETGAVKPNSYHMPTWISTKSAKRFMKEMDEASKLNPPIVPRQDGKKKSTHTAEPITTRNQHDEPGYAYKETVRCKEARAGLPCQDCYQCQRFYQVLRETGHDIVVEDAGRHRNRFAPPETPEDFWELDFIDELREKRKQEQKKKVI